MGDETAIVRGLESLVARHGLPYKVEVAISADFERIVGQFKRAALIIGIHGAGLSGMFFAAQCTTVIEVMWRDLVFANPTAFAAHAIALGHDYWTVFGNASEPDFGGLSTGVPMSNARLDGLILQTLREKQAAMRTGGNSALLDYCLEKSQVDRNRTYLAENNSSNVSRSTFSLQESGLLCCPTA